ncbi:MAG: GNAT family N-acetyltransferase [Mycobacteriaceae bacterium]
MTWDEMPETSRTWRVRARLADRPGALASLAARLGEHGCNLLGVTVLPVAGEPTTCHEEGSVVDELMLRAPASLRHGDLMAVVEAQGARCVGIVPASVGDLVDPQTAVLRSVATVLSGRGTAYEALRLALSADWVRPTADASDREAGEVRLEHGGHRATIALLSGEEVVASRGWAPFTAGELSRVPALVAVLLAADRAPDLPRAVTTSSSAGVVVRLSGPADEAAVLQMHRRATAVTLSVLHRNGVRQLPRGFAERLVALPRGRTLVAVAGREVVGFAQLIPIADGAGTVELSLWVEDEWRNVGVGTALLSVSHELARSSGTDAMVGQMGVQRVAARAGLSTAARVESGQSTVIITAGHRNGVQEGCSAFTAAGER